MLLQRYFWMSKRANETWVFSVQWWTSRGMRSGYWGANHSGSEGLQKLFSMQQWKSLSLHLCKRCVCLKYIYHTLKTTNMDHCMTKADWKLISNSVDFRQLNWRYRTSALNSRLCLKRFIRYGLLSMFTYTNVNGPYHMIMRNCYRESLFEESDDCAELYLKVLFSDLLPKLILITIA